MPYRSGKQSNKSLGWGPTIVIMLMIGACCMIANLDSTPQKIDDTDVKFILLSAHLRFIFCEFPWAGVMAGSRGRQAWDGREPAERVSSPARGMSLPSRGWRIVTWFVSSGQVSCCPFAC